ncbi:beta-ketoacyl-[acyl-carrier-protein] synthase family protein [Streptomyces syringium]|uniref:beta-ketoacyl-[acyl-carrier-protein] synthase family protein n=1 Tax=Streptomyces syringium TaxID=76729 RepID=UPI0036EB7FD5
MSRPEVVVTGVGLLTPAGIGAGATFAGLCAGRPTARPDPELRGEPVDFSCAVPGLHAEQVLGRRLSGRTDRFTHMAILAAREAVADAGLSPRQWPAAERVGVLLGSAGSATAAMFRETQHYLSGRRDRISPMTAVCCTPNASVTEVTIDLGARGPGFALSSACAAGNQAIALGCDLLRSGVCDIVVAGGSESARTVVNALLLGRLMALSRRRDDPAGACRPFDAARDGLVLGEGAGVLVLERWRDAAARGVTPRAVLAGHGAVSDAYHYVAPEPEGRGAEEAMRAALADAGLSPGDIDHVNAHATGTPAGDLAEARALRRLFVDVPPVTALKSQIGHALGAAGAIESAVAVLSLTQQTIPPTANLDHQDPAIGLDVVHRDARLVPLQAVMSNSFGFGGHNSVLVFTSD